MSLITEPSICIPRTLHNVTWRQVKDTFEQLFGRGTVERVDIVVNKQEEASPFCRIFVHMRYWPVNLPDVADIRKRLVDGEIIKVVYDNPWFWKCSASRTPKPERNIRTAPYIEFSTAAPSSPPPPTGLPVDTEESAEDGPDLEAGGSPSGRRRMGPDGVAAVFANIGRASMARAASHREVSTGDAEAAEAAAAVGEGDAAAAGGDAA